MDTKDKMQICKVVAQAVLADGQITDAEYDFLGKLIQKYELSPEQKKDVMARNFGDDAGAMAAEISAFDSKEQLLSELARAVVADGAVSSQERALIHKVAAALKVSEDELDALIASALA